MNMLHLNRTRGDWRPSSATPARRAALGAALALAAFAALFSAASCSKSEPATDSLVIYATDSFASDWGPGPAVSKAFSQATGIKVQIVARGDAGQMLSQAISEKKAPQADIVIGLDQQLLPIAEKADVLAAYAAKGLASLRPELRFDPKNRVIPFDYGYFALIWDSQSKIQPPSSLDDLLKPEYKKSIILMDPRTSSPGLGFLSWTLSRYGDGWKGYWQSLMPNVLTISPGWDSGYNLFLKGEAPLVLSYTTSPPYHVYADHTDRYKALVFAEGHACQIEGAAILKGAKNRKNAEAFLDFMLTPAFQKEIPLTNWMFPVLDSVALPDCYSAAPKVSAIKAPAPAALLEALDAWPDVASK